MIRSLVRKIAEQHHCRNTRLGFAVETKPGYQAQVIVQMVDKCTGASYEAAFSPGTATAVMSALAAAIREAG